MKKGSIEATGWGTCFVFSSVLWRCWLDERKDILPIQKTVPLISRGYLRLLERVEEEMWGEPADPGSPGKQPLDRGHCWYFFLDLWADFLWRDFWSCASSGCCDVGCDSCCPLVVRAVHYCNCWARMMLLLHTGSKCQRVRDLLSSGGRIGGNTNGQQSADRRTNAEGVAGYNQVLQSLSEEHTVFKAGMDVWYVTYSTPCFIKSGPLCILAITFSNVDRFEWKLHPCIR